MTHTLHRWGNYLNDDFITLCLPSKGLNEVGSANKVREYMKICAKHGCINMGSSRTGNMLENTLDEMLPRVPNLVATYGATFDGRDSLVAALKELKETEVGLSVVVTGVWEEVESVCAEAGLEPHTVNISLGFWGKTERLPEEDVLAVTTMCGHGMISANMVRRAADSVKGGASATEAAVDLGRVCHCGVFNTARAARLLEDLASKKA